MRPSATGSMRPPVTGWLLGVIGLRGTNGGPLSGPPALAARRLFPRGIRRRDVAASRCPGLVAVRPLLLVGTATASAKAHTGCSDDHRYGEARRKGHASHHPDLNLAAGRRGPDVGGPRRS